jgi:hypothetical protein
MKYRIFAHSRSGHHAFINWFANQTKGSTVFHNNTTKGWEDKNYRPNVAGKTTKYGEPPFKNKIFSFELFNLDNYDKYDFADEEYVDILFLRDFYNWSASLRKRKDKRFYSNWTNVRGEDEISLVDMWLQYAREFEGDKIFKDAVKVKYNDWFDNIDYRKEFCENLDLNFSDKGLNKISKYGDGSSYHKGKYGGVGQKLKVNERWKNHINDQFYIDLIKRNPEAVELNERIFNIKLISLNPLEIK